MQLLSLFILVMTMMAARAYHFEIATDETSFLQVGYEQVESKVHYDQHELVMMLPPGPLRKNIYFDFIGRTGRFDMLDANKSTSNLETISSSTGCPMYMTPQKYWPTELAQKYFGNRRVFGVLQDPYERLVDIFKSGMEGFSDRNATALAKCDVNAAVKKMMNETMHGNAFRDGCVFLPQAEYFEGPHKITKAVDHRGFPGTMNRFLQSHGYLNMHVRHKDISPAKLFEKSYCSDVWSGSLDCETRQMVRKFYARDFRLICKKFNYCSKKDSVCSTDVPGSCPESIMAESWGTGVRSGC